MDIEPIGLCVSSIHRRLQAYINEKLKVYQIGSAQLQYLLVISQNEGLNQMELSNRLKIGKATITKGVNALAKQGFLIKEKDLLDKRIFRIYLTQKGKDIIPIMEEIYQDIQSRLLEGVPKQEYDIVLNLLHKVNKNITNIK